MRTGLTAGSGMVLGMIFGIAVGHMVLGMVAVNTMSMCVPGSLATNVVQRRSVVICDST